MVVFLILKYKYQKKTTMYLFFNYFAHMYVHAYNGSKNNIAAHMCICTLYFYFTHLEITLFIHMYSL